ncbi:lipid-A-disaccharide synthase [Pseudochelatococcus lubricantis]|uniref:Lipid-A-disaccharide synthase n=1 Tax=Pseudochelatococcus lubricantis TaxID=1538102 RepID=A0ABX0UZR4_9HYPH|nr:lipid-A-disaccharide synthase [Pseudochelatococcus lubricantis]NIJ58426.1 lipid-A-disaccharide synthase [Pseudochelatococcus lubricantis]
MTDRVANNPADGLQRAGRKPPHVFLVAGEVSGDHLGAGLMRALRDEAGDVRFSGVGGAAMEGEGLQSLFSLSDIAVMGFVAVIARLRTIVARVHATVDAVVAARPDVLVVIDSPDFTHAVAKRVRKRMPDLPIVDYVSPSVWAWRPGRARKMRAYVDHLLALLPFEPEAHARLGGPPCSYVGHPLIERRDELRPAPGERPPLAQAERLNVLVLPGSRRSEVTRLLPVLGETLARVAAASTRPLRFVLPAVSHVAPLIREAVAQWPVQPEIVEGEAAKFAAFRQAHAALAASGTVTLELALSGVPMVVIYKVSPLEAQVRHFLTITTVTYANLILGEHAVPERLQWDCTPEKLTQTLLPLLDETPERQRQIEAFSRLETAMAIDAESPSAKAARIVLDQLRR